MVPEDLLFWISPLVDAPVVDPSVLCRRHADAMVVPRGWTLDDRRESALRLFKPRPIERPSTPARKVTRRASPPAERPEQLQIDGTGEIERPSPDQLGRSGESHSSVTHVDAGEPPASTDAPAAAWEPEFDQDDDLDGLLEVSTPLLARAFRGTGRPRR
jgi:hypothetical protein